MSETAGMMIPGGVAKSTLRGHAFLIASFIMSSTVARPSNPLRIAQNSVFSVDSRVIEIQALTFTKQTSVQKYLTHRKAFNLFSVS